MTMMLPMGFWVVYHPTLGRSAQPVWRGRARNAHHAQVLAERATGKDVGEAVACR